MATRTYPWWPIAWRASAAILAAWPVPSCGSWYTYITPAWSLATAARTCSALEPTTSRKRPNRRRFIAVSWRLIAGTPSISKQTFPRSLRPMRVPLPAARITTIVCSGMLWLASMGKK